MDSFIIKPQQIDTNDHIFSTVSKIHTKIKKLKKDSTSFKILSIVFDKDVKFINPLFFSLVIQLHKQYIHDEIIIVFDVLNFIQDKESKKDPRQHYVYRILLSIIDTPYFLTYQKQIEEGIDSFRANLDNVDGEFIKKIKNTIYKDLHENMYKKFIVLLYSRKHTDTIFLTKDEDKTYKLLPIIKLTNFPEYIYSNSLSSNEFDARKKIYESITIAANKDYDSSILKKNFVNNFINIVKPDAKSSSIAQPLKDIFFEMVDNIKRHAKYDNGSYADSYFNFYYDVPLKMFKFHIIDNLDTGFINTYIETLEKDKRLLREKGLKTDIFYDDALEYLANPDNDIKFLESFFSEYGWFRANKIPRILLHFGIPLLVEIIKRSSGEAYIRLHRSHENGDRFYEIKVSKNGTEVKTIKKKSEQTKGTYIIVNIPNGTYLQSIPVSRNLGQEDFKTYREDFEKKFTKHAKEKEKYAIYDYSQNTKKDSISDFIRKIYSEAHEKGILDVLVVNIDLRKNIEYFKTFAYLLYHKDYKDTDDFLPVNMLFWDKASFDIFFIGGKDRYQFCKSNELLYSHYGQKNNFILDELCIENGSHPAKSIFFTETEDNGNNFSVLPFELLTKEIVDKTKDERWKILSYQQTIMNHLEKNKINVHFDTQRGYHVDGFYKFDTIFQDSTFLERLVFILADKIINNKDLKEKQLVFIGFGKYLNLFIALLIDTLADMIGNTEKNIEIYEKYHIENNENFSNSEEKDRISKAKNFIESSRVQSRNVKFILLVPVMFSGEYIQKFIRNYKLDSNEFILLSMIQITLENTNSNFTRFDQSSSLLELQIPLGSYHEVKETYCPICSDPDKEKPLLKIDQTDEFKLEKVYFSSYEAKEFKSYSTVDDMKFYNSIAFGHIIRNNGSNHYLYYTKTVNFFNDNKNKKKREKGKCEEIKNIECFLKDIKEKQPIPQENLANTVILVPMHSTVNRFASLVYTIIFDGKANIFQLDKDKGIKNFHELKKQLDENKEYDFYFIDDEISSGYTLEYFYSLVCSFGKEGFERIFVLIDRTDKVDESLIINYIKNEELDRIHICTKMEIKPIKTEVEECFLCKTREKYVSLLKNTSLDLNRFAIADKIVKLNFQDSKLYDFEDPKEFNVKDFRRYLKMYAVDYIYKNFESIYKINGNQEILDADDNEIRSVFVEHFNNIEEKFIEKVKNKIDSLPFKEKEKYNQIFQQIAKYEGSIIFIKALAFPKLVYYYNIRYMLTVVLIDRIKNYLKKNAIEPILDQNSIKSFIDLQENDKYENFLEHFSSKINMNYLSFLQKTASYLDIHYVIHPENIKKYHVAAKQIKDHDPDKDRVEPDLDQSLVEYYQLAAKMVAQYSQDRANYLFDKLDEVLKDKSIVGYPNLTKALAVENHYDEKVINFQKTIKQILSDDKEFVDTIKDIENVLKNVTDDDTLKIESVFVNRYADLKYSSYFEYLEKMYLVDVANNYVEPKNDIVYHITKGYLSARENEIFNHKYDYHKQRMNNTWVNKYEPDYIIGKTKITKATLIKLVDIDPNRLNTPKDIRIDNIQGFLKDNNTLWYRPFGCIVVSYEKSDRKKHLKLSKYLLSVQGEIVSYLKDKFSHGVIQEAIQNKEYENIFRTFNHEVAPLFEIHNLILKEDIDRTKLANYTLFMQEIVKIGRFKKDDDVKYEPGYSFADVFNKNKSTIEDFMEIAHTVRSEYKKVNIDNNTDVDKFKIPIGASYIKPLFYELIFNAMKNIDPDEPEFKIYTLDSALYFENKFVVNSSTSRTDGIALSYLDAILSKVDYRLEHFKEGDRYFVKIVNLKKGDADA